VYFTELKVQSDITNKDISAALKRAATVLDYPTAKGIPIDRIDTHSLPSSRANAYPWQASQIWKFKRWTGSMGPPSKNTYKRNLHPSQRAYNKK
jgi:hypothetical protein